jgi:hypothetical protein
MRKAGQWSLLDGADLEDDVYQETSCVDAEVVGGKSIRRRGDQLDAPTHLRCECADEREEQEPEGDDSHTFNRRDRSALRLLRRR